jgi:hypothetical protein
MALDPTQAAADFTFDLPMMCTANNVQCRDPLNSRVTKAMAVVVASQAMLKPILTVCCLQTMLLMQ